MKRSALNGFNWIAGSYDGLAKAVLGNSITESQKIFLNEISPGSKVLILGGGTGWLLQALYAVVKNCEVWYIEASSEMLLCSQKKIKADFKVHLIHGTEDDIPNEIRFDVVITNFYLDLFDAAALQMVVEKIGRNLVDDALWLATDFTRTHSLWHRTLLLTMYLFFRMTTGIQAKSLPDWESVLRRNNLITVKDGLFYGGFIHSQVLRYAPAR